MQNEARHTLYSECIRKQNSAIEIIINCHRFLFPDSPDKDELKSLIEQDISPYLVKVDAANSPLQQQINNLQDQETVDNEIQKSIEDKQGYLHQYTQDYENSVQIYQEVQPQLKALETAKDVFLSPESKRHEYLYIIDDETAASVCKKQGKEKDCRISFSNKNIVLKDNQTDAVRIWRNNVEISQLTIRDNRVDIDTAHRDGIQLIPPPKFQEKINEAGEKVLVKKADQMAGMILENTTVKNCDILAPKAALQGIFSSDGMCRKLKIDHVKVGTQGGHAISIAGVLTECEFTNISLYQQQDFSAKKAAPTPEIALFPVRIGGNMADDGMIYILDFKLGSGHQYGSFVDSNNKLYLAGSKTSKNINVTDYRKIIPERYKVMACGLSQFDYDKYIHEYSNWTMADFKKELPTAYQQMKAWIKRRFKEYSSGTRETENIIIGNNQPIEIELRSITPEQKNRKPFGVWDMLSQAQKALNREDPEWLNTRLPDLHETAIRSFTMKSIAIRNGTISPLYDLGDNHNAMRKAYLHFMLSDADFNKPMIAAPYPDKQEPAKEPPQAIKPKASEVWSSPADADLKAALRASPSLSVNKNETITLFFAPESGYNEAGTSYKWTISGYAEKIPAGKQKSYTIETAKLDVKDKHRIFCEVTKNGKMQRVIAYFNVKEATAEAEPEKPQDITPQDTWSRTPTLKSDLRVTPSQTPNKGQKVKFYFQKTSKYNDSSYTFRWSLSEHPELGTGKGKSRTIDTSKLNAREEYRLVFSVNKTDGSETHTGSVNFTVEVAEATDAEKSGEANSTAIPTISASEFTTHKPSIIKDTELITAGDTVTFSFDAEYEGARYYWILDDNGITPISGSKNKLIINTIDIDHGRYRLRATITSKNREQHQLQINIDIVHNWIGIELDTEHDISQYQGDQYELTLTDGSKIAGQISDQKVFRIDVPANVQQAEFRWVD